MTDERTPPPSTPPSPSRSGSPGGSGLEPNVAGALSYLLGPVTGLLFLILDKDRPFVRFHAVQCLVVTLAWVVVSMALMMASAIMGFVPVLGVLFTTLSYMAVSLVAFVLWLALMYRAFNGEEWQVPLLGEYARRYAAQV